MNSNKTKCNYCGTEKNDGCFVIGASNQPDWTMIEGTGKMTCPDCYEEAVKEGQERISQHIRAHNTKNTLKTDWTEVGREYLQTPEDKEKVLSEAKRLQWKEIEEGLTVGLCPGSAIKNAIKELRIPKVDRIAIGGGFGLSKEPEAAYGFYGIQGNYKNARVEIFILDDGCSCTPLFMQVYSK